MLRLAPTVLCNASMIRNVKSNQGKCSYDSEVSMSISDCSLGAVPLYHVYRAIVYMLKRISLSLNCIRLSAPNICLSLLVLVDLFC